MKINSRPAIVLLLFLLLALPLLAVGTGKTAGGFAVIGKPITAIDGDGTTTPWRASSGVYAISVDGEFDGASVVVQWRLCGTSENADCSGFAFGTMPFSSTATEKREWGNLQLYHKAEVRLLISSAGGSTDITAIMRGQKSGE